MVWSEHATLQKILTSKIKRKDDADFDSKAVIHHEYIPEGQTVNATFYVQVLDHLSKHIAV